MSKPIIVFTEQEIRKVVPDFCEEFLTTHKSDVAALFWNLGMDCRNHGIEVQHNLVTRNRFGEIDETTRYVSIERTDTAWKLSPNSSHESRIYSDDITLRKDINKMTKGVKETHVKKEND